MSEVDGVAVQFIHNVMVGLVPAIHASIGREDVDARHKAGHDDADVGAVK
jgi:hypothetical protein